MTTLAHVLERIAWLLAGLAVYVAIVSAIAVVIIAPRRPRR